LKIPRNAVAFRRNRADDETDHVNKPVVNGVEGDVDGAGRRT